MLDGVALSAWNTHMPHSMGVKLCEDYSDLKMDLLKVPHHGGDKDSKCFLKLLNPNIQLFQ